MSVFELEIIRLSIIAISIGCIVYTAHKGILTLTAEEEEDDSV